MAINAIRSRLGLESEVMDLADCRDAMTEGVRNSIPVAIACAAVGIVVGVATLTGIALDAADAVVNLGQAIPSEMLRLLVTLALVFGGSVGARIAAAKFMPGANGAMGKSGEGMGGGRRRGRRRGRGPF